MDIDKDFIKGLGIPPDAPPTKAKMGNIDVAIIDDETGNNPVTVAETAEDAISAMSTNPFITNETVIQDETTEAATIVVETEKQSQETSETENTSTTEMTEMLTKISEVSSALSKLASEVAGIKTGISRFDGYEKAVEALKRSLAANQRNEENIYKELEEYKKNQYYNFIRPFLEFLINLLTDMINSRKQYEDDRDEFIAQHGQEIYDEIIELHGFYVQQIESQLQIQGVEIVNYESGTPFVSIEQIISKPILTEDSSLAGTVGKVDSACYKFEDKILKKAKVHVYKVKPTENK